MKITVSARGNSLDSKVDPRFGRCAGFVLFDSATGQSTYLDNRAGSGPAGSVGVKTARLIVGSGAQAVITGQMGPKARQVLARAGIEVYDRAAGTVREAIEALERKMLGRLDKASMQVGPGKMGGRGAGVGRRRPIPAERGTKGVDGSAGAGEVTIVAAGRRTCQQLKTCRQQGRS